MGHPHVVVAEEEEGVTNLGRVGKTTTVLYCNLVVRQRDVCNRVTSPSVGFLYCIEHLLRIGYSEYRTWTTQHQLGSVLWVLVLGQHLARVAFRSLIRGQGKHLDHNGVVDILLAMTRRMLRG